MLTLQAPNEFNALQLAARAALDLEPWWVAPPFHLNYFDFASLERLLTAGGFAPAGRDATYPMEWFLLAGEDYVRDGDLGADCHGRRMRLELALEQLGERRAAAPPTSPPAASGARRSSTLVESLRREGAHDLGIARRCGSARAR